MNFQLGLLAQTRAIRRLIKKDSFSGLAPDKKKQNSNFKDQKVKKKEQVKQWQNSI
jgi:hypothetical protein